MIKTGDAYNVLDELEPESIDMVYTSPNPAFWATKCGITDPKVLGTEKDTILYMEHLLKILEKVRRVLKKTGSLWLQIADHYHVSTGNVMMIPEQMAFNMVTHNWHLMNTCIWSRRSVLGKVPPRTFIRDWEHLFWFVKEKGYYFNENCRVNGTSVFEYPFNAASINDNHTEYESGHPKQLIEIAMKATCPPNGTVLDPFMGGPKTGKVALESGRKFIGIEIIPERAARAAEVLAK